MSDAAMLRVLIETTQILVKRPRKTLL